MTEEKTSVKETQEKQLSSEELQQLFDQDKQVRRQKCKNEIDKILQKHKCQLVAVPRITADGRLVAVTSIQFLAEG